MILLAFALAVGTATPEAPPLDAPRLLRSGFPEATLCGVTVGDIDSALIDIMTAAGFRQLRPTATSIWIKPVPKLNSWPTRAFAQINWQKVVTSNGIRLIGRTSIIEMAAFADSKVGERDNVPAIINDALQSSLDALAEMAPCPQ